MALSWNEIKDRAVKFSKEWADASSEDAEAQSFLNAFFEVFGISRKSVGRFEHKVKKINEADGYIDLLWKGTILIEMKSAGKDLNKAFEQAKEYALGLKEAEVPKYILVSDFKNFRLYDSEEQTTAEFKLTDFVKNVHLFGSIAGYLKRTYKEQDPVNIKAAELMGKLHDRLKEVGYTGHPLEVFLVRLLFCLFAEDTTIFNKFQFQDFIEQRTAEDGSDLAAKIQELFQVFNTPEEKRFKNLDEQLAAFPYVNGKLFEENLPTASFDTKMRQALLDCCHLDWSKISPAIFGSMFQSVMNPQERRNLGAHYTSEKNILKLIKPLFLDELWVEFEGLKGNKNKLIEFHKKLSQLKFLDPACGCGNFLVITYRELRLLEIAILKKLHNAKQSIIDVSEIIWLDVDQFYGIEIEEFPARIAEVAMWLIDHQMNMLTSETFGQYFVRLPLQKAANIVYDNALRIDWETVVPKDKLSYILGNPPFVGSKMMNKTQKEDLNIVFENAKNIGDLDYVTAWYMNATKFIKETKIKVAFVSTNSITQGEQVGILWSFLSYRYKIKIHFAHRTFKWSNEAKGNAAVYCVIIGFANYDVINKKIFEYEDIKGEPLEIITKNINPYLVDAKDVLLVKRSKSLCKAPYIKFGNQPIDGGWLILSEEEKKQAILKEPNIEKFIRKYYGSEEFINGRVRFCLWFEENTNPTELKKSKFIYDRLKNVRQFRLESVRKETQKLAANPSQFAFISHEETDYIIIPSVSSENRKYIPIGFMPANTIASNLCLIIPKGKIFHFGILTSLMHMAWVKYTCGRLKSDFRYSNTIVYNNFPWPENPTAKQIKAIEVAAQKVLDVREELQEPSTPAPFSKKENGSSSSPTTKGERPKSASLADLYDSLAMPPKLLKAHNELDKAVDLAYRPFPFPNDAKRMEFLFELYEKYTAGLFKEEKVKKGRGKK